MSKKKERKTRKKKSFVFGVCLWCSSFFVFLLVCSCLSSLFPLHLPFSFPDKKTPVCILTSKRTATTSKKHQQNVPWKVCHPPSSTPFFFSDPFPFFVAVALSFKGVITTLESTPSHQRVVSSRSNTPSRPSRFVLPPPLLQQNMNPKNQQKKHHTVWDSSDRQALASEQTMVSCWPSRSVSTHPSSCPAVSRRSWKSTSTWVAA